MTECKHVSGKILTYNVPPYRWLEQCKDCGRLAYVTMDNHIVELRPAPSAQADNT